MKNGKKIGLIAVSALVIAIVVGSVVGLFVGNNKPLAQTSIQPISEENKTKNEAWASNYPAQYESYLSNKDVKDGDKQPSHFDSRPYMQIMYKGTGYAAEFNEPRGHVYAIEDIKHVDPKRWELKQAACFTCKSPQIPELMAEDPDFSKRQFKDVADKITEPIGCANCHDPATNELKITQPALIEAYAAKGIDVNSLGRQEKRSLVCGQCHVTYYFDKESNKATFPWGEGFKAEDQLAYYEKLNFTESVHPDTGTKLVKPRHAEFETFQGSVHQSAGVSCADCHMPYTKEGNQKISSHKWQSPLENIDQSCMACHREGEEWLRGNVDRIQSMTKEMSDRGGAVVVDTINILKVANNTPGVDQAKLEQARNLHRYGQYLLDYVYVTNGYGFHNPTGTAQDLSTGIDYCQQASFIAAQAIQEAGGKVPEVTLLPAGSIDQKTTETKK